MPSRLGRCRLLVFLILLLALWRAPGHASDRLSPPGPIDLVDRLANRHLLRPDSRTRVALALSGGGARGLAQIGVLRAFAESGIVVDVVCGVSMGAIIGGLYASGVDPDSLESLARSIAWTELLQNSPPRARLLLSQKDKTANWFISQPLQGFRPRWPTGAITGQGLYNYFSRLTRRASYRCRGNFDSLPISFRAVAADLVTGDRVIFDSGELAFAMRAAMAFPLAVTPLREGKRLYADGGLVDPLPVELARSLSPYPVVAVNTTSGLAPAEDLRDPYAVANQATTIMTARQLAEALASADYVCAPPVEGIASVGFGDIDTLLAIGYAAGRELAARILADRDTSDRVIPSSHNSQRRRLRLAETLPASDCPPFIDKLANTETEIALDTLMDSLNAALYRGWWSEAVIAKPGKADSDGGFFIIDARRPPAVEEYRFRGATVFSDSILTAAMNIPHGEISDYESFACGFRRITDLYAAHEYTLASVTAAVLDTGGVLTVTIDEAPLAGVRLTGNDRVKGWVVLRNFPLRTGLPFNARKVADGVTDLQATGLFDQITTEVIRTAAGPVLHLKVTEKTTDALRLGLHYNDEYQTESFIQWANINLFGLGNELILHAQYAPRRELYFLSVRSDRIFRTYLSATLRVYYDRLERRRYTDHDRSGSFTTIRRGFEASFAQNISRVAQLAVRIRSEQLDFNTDSTESRTQHAKFDIIARVDDLDDANFPTRGRRMEAILSWADDFLDGDIQYRAFVADGFWVVSPNPRLALAGEAQFATSDRPLPDHERRGLGGRRSFSGLYEDEFLEDHLVVGSLHARYQIYPFSYLIGRIDVGNAWRHGSEIEFWRALRFGTAVGLKFDTPIGPLVMMQGVADRGDGKFYFSWGYDF